MLLIPQMWTPIETLLHIIITKYLNLSYCIIIISEDNLFIKSPNSVVRIFAKDNESFTSLMLNASEMGCSDYIVQINEPETFMKAFEDVVHLGNVRKGDRKIIMLPTLQDLSDKKSQLLLNVLSMKETSFVANILLLLPSDAVNESHIYHLVTHKFVGSHENNKPILLDSWNFFTEKFEKNACLFPHNMTNLEGKTVKVTGFTYKPYILLELDPNVVPNGRDGLDIRIVEEFCR